MSRMRMRSMIQSFSISKRFAPNLIHHHHQVIVNSKHNWQMLTNCEKSYKTKHCKQLKNYKSYTHIAPDHAKPQSLHITTFYIYLSKHTCLFFWHSQLNRLPNSIYSITKRPLGIDRPRNLTMFLWSSLRIIWNSFWKSLMIACVRILSRKLIVHVSFSCSLVRKVPLDGD